MTTQADTSELMARINREAGYQAYSWRYAARDAGLLLAGLGVVAVAAGPIAAGLVTFPATLIACEVHESLNERRQWNLRRDLMLRNGLTPEPTLFERLGGLLGKLGQVISGRAARDLKDGAWGANAHTVAYEVTRDGVRPVSAEWAAKARAARQDFSHVSVTRDGATVLNYSHGALASRDTSPAVLRYNADNQLIGAIWHENGKPRRSVGLSGELRLGFNPDTLAKQIAGASLRRGPDFPLTCESRELHMDTVAWEAVQIASGLRQVRGPEQETAQRCANILSEIARYARGMHADGTRTLRLDVGYPTISERDLDNLRSQMEGAYKASIAFRQHERSMHRG